MMFYFGTPFRRNIFKTGWRNDRETDKEHVSLWVGQRSQTVIVLLTGCVPKTKGNWDTVTHHGGRIVIKHSRNIFSWKAVCCIRDEHARLAHSPVPHHHTLDWPPTRHRPQTRDLENL